MSEDNITKVIDERDIGNGRKLQWIITEQRDGTMSHQIGVDAGEEEWVETFFLNIKNSRRARKIWDSLTTVVELIKEGD